MEWVCPWILGGSAPTYYSVTHPPHIQGYQPRALPPSIQGHTHSISKSTNQERSHPVSEGAPTTHHRAQTRSAPGATNLHPKIPTKSAPTNYLRAHQTRIQWHKPGALLPSIQGCTHPHPWAPTMSNHNPYMRVHTHNSSGCHLGVPIIQGHIHSTPKGANQEQLCPVFRGVPTTHIRVLTMNAPDWRPWVWSGCVLG